MDSQPSAPPADVAPRTASLRLDLDDQRAWLDGRQVTLAPKAFAVLACLAQRCGKLTPKREILAKVWPGVFVHDSVLKVAVRDIRVALGDDARHPRVIQTVHHRGYRLIAEVAIVDTSRRAGVPATRGGRVGVSPEIARRFEALEERCRHFHVRRLEVMGAVPPHREPPHREPPDREAALREAPNRQRADRELADCASPDRDSPARTLADGEPPDARDIDLLVEFAPLPAGPSASAYAGVLEAIQDLCARQVDVAVSARLRFRLTTSGSCR